MFDIPPDGIVSTVWYYAYDRSESPDGDRSQVAGDFMAVVWRDSSTSGWRSKMRFRQQVDNKVWDSQDTKSWYEVKEQSDSEADRQKLIESIDMAMTLGARAMPWMKFDIKVKHEINGPAKAFWDWLMQQPWCSVRTEPLPKQSELKH